jgi:cysteine desulfuration protein SufE
MSIDELIGDFAFLDDWEERYKHVIELGKTLEPLEEHERSPETKVQGCVSQVWLVTKTDGGSPPRLTFRGTSDAHIVRGLIAILFVIYNGKTPGEILAIDAAGIFGQLGLDEHLSPQRSNGLYAMVGRIRADAERALAGAG